MEERVCAAEEATQATSHGATAGANIATAPSALKMGALLHDHRYLIIRGPSPLKHSIA